MTQEELIKTSPQRSFTKEFTAKKKALLDLERFNVDSLNSKEAQYQRLFDYDKSVESLKKFLTQNKNLSLTRAHEEKIGFHFTNITELNHFLGQLNLNDADVNNVFMPFDNHARGKGLFDKMLLKVTGGQDIPTGEYLTDRYIEDISKMKNELLADEIDEEKIKQAAQISNKIIDNKKKYDDATVLADNWIKTEGKAVSLSIKNKADIFNRKADGEHSSKNINKWLYSSIGSGAITLFVICYFIKTIPNDMSLGAALLRISALVVVSFFTFLFSQQYLTHRRLYESYKFKAIVLTTMEEMIKSYTNQKDRELIFNKAIENIFSEPYLREEKMIQQKLIDSALDIAKKKL